MEEIAARCKPDGEINPKTNSSSWGEEDIDVIRVCSKWGSGEKRG